MRMGCALQQFRRAGHVGRRPSSKRMSFRARQVDLESTDLELVDLVNCERRGKHSSESVGCFAAESRVVTRRVGAAQHLAF